MKLLFDFRAYQEFYPRGVSRYVYELFSRVMALNETGENAILVNPRKRMPVFSPRVLNRPDIYSVRDFERDTVHKCFDVFVNGSSTWLGLSRYASLDVLYPEKVLKQVKYKTCILYDFVPLLYDHYLPTKRDEINYLLQCEAIRYMDHIFTISEYVSRTGAAYLNRRMEDFTNLYGGADLSRFHSPQSGKRYTREGRTHDLVNVSGACWRKNFEGVTEAFCKAYQSGEIPDDARLVFICSAPPFFDEAIRTVVQRYHLTFGKQVLVTDYISDGEMVDFIAKAACSIFPSYYEGLGLPVLESYAVGTPCIASNTSSIKELITEGAAFDPFSLDDMQRKIKEVYWNEKMLEESLAFGRELLKKLSWENSAQIMMKRLKGMVGKDC